MSLQRECLFQKCSDQKWYLYLADHEYGGLEDATVYGPFTTEEAVHEELDRHSNPGGYSVDTSGKSKPPTKSPNGRPVVKSTKMTFSFPRFYR